jgi:hypothetical protein
MGRWTVKPEEIPESELPKDLRLMRAFFIVIFAHGKVVPPKEVPGVCKLFNSDKERLLKSIEGVGIPLKDSGAIGFKYKANPRFETAYKDIAAKGQAEILKLKEAVCMAKHAPDLFDPYLK